MLKPHEFFKKLQTAIPQLEIDIAKKIIQVEAQRFVKNNFETEAFDGKPWARRKKPETADEGTRNQDGSKKGRALLVQSGKLKRQATRPKTIGNHVDFIFTLPYAEVHNEGLKAGRGAGFTMPQRRFIGESPKLAEAFRIKAVTYLNKKLLNL